MDSSPINGMIELMTISKISTVLAPSSLVYDWHTRPGAFQRLVPPWESIQLVNETGSFDQKKVTLRMKRWGIPIRWVAKHVDVMPPDSFTDVQVTGPFSRWHHKHEFLPLSDTRTKMIDTIDYRLPLHRITTLTSNWLIRRDLNRMLRYRHNIVKHDLALLNNWPMPRQVVAISGASGLIGRHLSTFLRAAGHTVKHLVRRDHNRLPHDIHWDPQTGIMGDFSDVTVIIHLAGESIASPIRWSDSKKRRIYASRVQSTSVLATQLATCQNQVKTLICASGIGIYPHSDHVMDEDGPTGNGFLSNVVSDWESACDPIRDRIRVVHTRLGVVLHPNGGMLQRLRPIMKAGLLGRIGDGTQWMSWVALEDVLRALYVSMANTNLLGPVNVVSPYSTTQIEWIREWARHTHRPSLVPLPTPIVTSIMGEMGHELLLASQHVVPKKLLETDFQFQCTSMSDVCDLYQL